jgi:hypothetical protein
MVTSSELLPFNAFAFLTAIGRRLRKRLTRVSEKVPAGPRPCLKVELGFESARDLFPPLLFLLRLTFLAFSLQPFLLPFLLPKFLLSLLLFGGRLEKLLRSSGTRFWVWMS